MAEAIMLIGGEPTGKTRYLGCYVELENSNTLKLFHFYEKHYQHPETDLASIPVVEQELIGRYVQGHQSWSALYLLLQAQNNVEDSIFEGPLCRETVELPNVGTCFCAIEDYQDIAEGKVCLVCDKPFPWSKK